MFDEDDGKKRKIREMKQAPVQKRRLGARGMTSGLERKRIVRFDTAAGASASIEKMKMELSYESLQDAGLVAALVVSALLSVSAPTAVATTTLVSATTALVACMFTSM